MHKYIILVLKVKKKKKKSDFVRLPTQKSLSNTSFNYLRVSKLFINNASSYTIGVWRFTFKSNTIQPLFLMNPPPVLASHVAGRHPLRVLRVCVISLLIPPWFTASFPYITDPRLQVTSVYYWCDNVETIIHLQWRPHLCLLLTHQHVRVPNNNNNKTKTTKQHQQQQQDIGCSCCKVGLHTYCTVTGVTRRFHFTLPVQSGTDISSLGVSESGNGEYDISRDIFSHKSSAKMGRVVPQNMFWPRKKLYYMTFPK